MMVREKSKLKDEGKMKEKEKLIRNRGGGGNVEDEVDELHLLNLQGFLK